MGSSHVGTSGWSYDHWKGIFYPSKLPKKSFLEFYSEHFNTVEINQTFYGLPDRKTIRNWYNSVPKNFVFSVKASRYITYMKKLKVPKGSISTFFNRVDTLKDKLGPILFQLPPDWKLNLDRFKWFLKILPSGYQYAFECRDPSWWCREFYGLLEKRGIAFCIHDLGGKLAPKRVTAKHLYLRLHGPDTPYEGEYSKETLLAWARDFVAWKKIGKEVYCYFDNDKGGYAPKDAERLAKKVIKEKW